MASRDDWLRFIILAPLAERPMALGFTPISFASGYGCRAFDAHFVRIYRQRMRLEPERASRDGRIDTGLLPPGGLIATADEFAVMAPA